MFMPEYYEAKDLEEAQARYPETKIELTDYKDGTWSWDKYYIERTDEIYPKPNLIITYKDFGVQAKFHTLDGVKAWLILNENCDPLLGWS